MMAETRWPMYSLDGAQIGWQIVHDVLPTHGVVPRRPSDCPWYREDGHPHVCLAADEEAGCDDLVALGRTKVVCVRGVLLTRQEAGA